VRGHDDMGYRGTSDKCHSGNDVRGVERRSRVDEATRDDCEQQEVQREWACGQTRADGEQAPSARVKIIFRSRQTDKPRHPLAATVSSSH
jgi:hypothetical protein